MWTNIARRILGLAVVGWTVAYFGAKYFEYDLPHFDLPSWFHSPAFWGGMTVLAIWSWLPVSQPVGPVNASLAQEMPRQFQQPQRIENEPFEMNGQWCIIWHGQYMIWSEETGQWVPYRG